MCAYNRIWGKWEIRLKINGLKNKRKILLIGTYSNRRALFGMDLRDDSSYILYR